ncbi:MAG: S1C family serine protease [Christensenellales bacterium]|jgi:serine protease Do
MHTNDYRPNGVKPDMGNHTEPAGHNPEQPYGVPQQSGYGYNGYYNPILQEGRKKPGTGKIMAVVMTMIILICLVAGGVFTAYVIMPAVNPPGGSAADIALASEGPRQDLQQGDNAAAGNQSGIQPDLTTDLPDIGGQAPDISSSKNPIVQIAQKVGPAVVGVTVSVDQPTIGHGMKKREYGYGTGIILTENGYIVTNNHVVSGSDSIKITLFDDTEYQAKIVGADATTDLAVLKVDATGLTAAAFGESDNLQVGETVVAIGNPLGSELAGSVTSGIVSALNREITTNGYSQKYIQTDAAINPGNSGGPLVNMKGEVIGINTLKSYLAGYDDYGMPIGTEGIGFAIPISAARPIIEQLKTKGSIDRPGIGISCLVDETHAYNPSGAPTGVTIIEIVQGGPADIAGLQPYDIITSIEGKAVSTVVELTTIIQSYNIGDQLNLSVWRDGLEYKARVTVGDLNKMG